MEVILLGTGAADPPTDRDHTSLAVAWSGGFWLVDCASSPHRRLRMARLDPARLRGVIITHDHPDHLYGLPSLVHNLIADPLRGETLPILAAEETMKTARKLLEAFGLEARSALPLHLEQIQARDDRSVPAWEADGMRIAVDRAEHSRETLAVRFEAEGSAMTYSSDTRPCAGVARLAAGADVLVHEATFLEISREAMPRGHSTARDAGRVAAAAGVRDLIMVHFSRSAISEPGALMAEARAEFSGNVILGEDLAHYPV